MAATQGMIVDAAGEEGMSHVWPLERRRVLVSLCSFMLCLVLLTTTHSTTHNSLPILTRIEISHTKEKWYFG